jgi:hypothetical protein
MNLKLTIPIAAAALGLLAGCGNAGEAAGVRDPDTTGSATTDAVSVDSLEAAHAQCTGDSAKAELAARHDEVGTIFRDVLKITADGEGLTRDQFIDQVMAEMYNADEQTLTIYGAYGADSDYGMTESGLLAGIVYDCALDALAIPERVLDHIGTTRALDGQQEDSWDDYQARWTYHPDHGVNLTIWTD